MIPIGKKEPRGNNQHFSHYCIVGHFVGTSTLILSHKIAEGSAGPSTTRNLTVTEERRGICNNQRTDLGRPSVYLQCPSSGPNHCGNQSGFLICTTKSGLHWNHGDSVKYRSLYPDPQTRSFAGPRTQASMPRKGA